MLTVSVIRQMKVASEASIALNLICRLLLQSLLQESAKKSVNLHWKEASIRADKFLGEKRYGNIKRSALL
jgi:hypothetical protein